MEPVAVTSLADLFCFFQLLFLLTCIPLLCMTASLLSLGSADKFLFWLPSEPLELKKPVG